MNALARHVVALATRAADVAATDGGDLVDVDMGELADGSGRPFALVTVYSAGLEQVYRITAPAPFGAPAWASGHGWTVELRRGDEFVRIQDDDEPTLCTVHEAGACPPGCEHAHGYTDVAAGEPPPRRTFEILERLPDGGWEVVGQASGRTGWEALAEFQRDLLLTDSALYVEPGGRPVLRDGDQTLSARPQRPTVGDLLEAARQDTVGRLFELLRLFGIEGVAGGAIADAARLDFRAIVDVAEAMTNAASAVTVLDDPQAATS